MAFDHAEIVRDGVRSSRWAAAAATWDVTEAAQASWDARGTSA